MSAVSVGSESAKGHATRQALVLAGLTMLILIHASAARADPVLLTVEAGPWPAAVAALQADPHSEGRVLHLYLEGPRGDRLPCDSVDFALDAASAAAFTLGACDAQHRSTPLRLQHRAALFRADGAAPQPAALGITGREIHAVHDVSDDRAVDATRVHCSVDVTPAVRDLAHGARVELLRERYELRPTRSDISASPIGSGWHLAGTGSATLTVEYDVVDRQTRAVVLHDRATLACGADPGPGAQLRVDCPEIPLLPLGATLTSEVRSALDANPDAPGGCTGSC